MTIGHRDPAVRLGGEVVLEDLLHVSGLGPVERRVALRRLAGARTHRRGRGEELGAVVDHWPADVHVVEQHVRRRIEALVGDLVPDRQARLAERNLDPASEHQVLSEDRGLADLALGEEDAVVAVPALPVAEEPSRRSGDPSVEPVALGRLRRVVELSGRVLGRAEGVVEPARRQKAGAEPAQKAEALRLGKPRAGEPGRRDPGQ